MMEDFVLHDADYDPLTSTELMSYISKGGLLQRTRALAALARRTNIQPEVLPEVIKCINDPKQQMTRVMGTISPAHVAVAALWTAHTSDALQAIQRLLATWPEPDRSDLLRFLTDQSIPIAEVMPNTPLA
jgi:hypothetical protein